MMGGELWHRTIQKNSFLAEDCRPKLRKLGGCANVVADHLRAPLDELDETMDLARRSTGDFGSSVQDDKRGDSRYGGAWV
ncbi:protein of unknown function [Paraburkholderia kururiensis]